MNGHSKMTAENGSNLNTKSATTSTTKTTTSLSDDIDASAVKVIQATNGNTNKYTIVGKSEESITIEKKNQTAYAILQRWFKLLVTKEDYVHHHKTLGILCLLSFCFRFILQIFFYPDMGFQQYPQLTIPTICLHTMLTVSSFQFKIPIRRIRDGGRIWPQYRYHSLIFTLRSTLLLALYYYEEEYRKVQQQQSPLYFVNYLIIMASMSAVEYVNYMVGEEQRSNTIRDLDGSGYVKFLFSTMQYNSIAFFLIGIRTYSVPFYALFTIQLTPFIGTLRRKLIFTSNFWGSVLYASMLVGGFSIQAYQYHLAGGETLHLYGRCIGLFAALIRFTSIVPKSLSIVQDKFVIWTAMFMITRHHRATNFDIPIDHLRIFLCTLIALLALTAHHKVQSGYYPNDVKHAKQMKLA